MKTETTSNSNLSENENYSSNNQVTIEPHEHDLNYYASLNCSDEIKEIIMKLFLEVKEYENTLDQYQYKYMKKKISKKESLDKYKKENLDNMRIISLLKEILEEVNENKGQMYVVKIIKN